MNAAFTHYVPRVEHRYAELPAGRVFFRAAGPAGAPTLLALHGFPSSSHQFRRLIDALGGRYRVVAPDMPGFGFTEADAGRPASFDGLADVMEAFCAAIGLTRFVLYAFDFGGPVGFRLAERRPEWIAGLVIQNANAYAEGLGDDARAFIAARREVPAEERAVREFMTLDGTRSQYEQGAGDPSAIAPDAWTLDQHFLDRPGRLETQLDLAFDYRSNVALYPRWQAWLREHRPPTLVVWGRNDPIFPEPGALAYRRDLPEADVHLLDAGHFALEEQLPAIAPLVAAHLDRCWTPADRRRMRLAVIGASGHLGGAVAREALRRGHGVTAIARDAARLHGLDGNRAVAADVLDDAVADVVRGHDAVVVAVKGADAAGSQTPPAAARRLLELLPAAGVRRLLFVGGGGSLRAPSGERFVDLPQFPVQYRPEALGQAEALDVLRASNGALDWTYVSPPPVHLVDGPRTGTYTVAAGDAPVIGADGESRIALADLAAAVVDVAERGAYAGQRITVGY